MFGCGCGVCRSVRSALELAWCIRGCCWRLLLADRLPKLLRRNDMIGIWWWWKDANVQTHSQNQKKRRFNLWWVTSRYVSRGLNWPIGRSWRTTEQEKFAAHRQRASPRSTIREFESGSVKLSLHRTSGDHFDAFDCVGSSSFSALLLYWVWRNTPFMFWRIWRWSNGLLSLRGKASECSLAFQRRNTVHSRLAESRRSYAIYSEVSKKGIRAHDELCRMLFSYQEKTFCVIIDNKVQVFTARCEMRALSNLRQSTWSLWTNHLERRSMHSRWITPLTRHTVHEKRML